jgi:hypothetical protein
MGPEHVGAGAFAGRGRTSSILLTEAIWYDGVSGLVTRVVVSRKWLATGWVPSMSFTVRFITGRFHDRISEREVEPGMKSFSGFWVKPKRFAGIAPGMSAVER